MADNPAPDGTACLQLPSRDRKGAVLSRYDLAAGLSFANLMYFRVWSEMIDSTRTGMYAMKSPPPPAEFAACMTNVVVFGVLWALLLRYARHEPCGRFATAARWGLLLSLALPLNAVWTVAMNLFPLLTPSALAGIVGRKALIVSAALASLAGAFVFYRWHRTLIRAAAAVLLVFSPFVALNFARGVWNIVAHDAAPYAEKPLAPLLHPARASPRIVWILWDSWDQQLTFIRRPSHLRLPEVDRFRSAALYAANAYPPAGKTMPSVPALLTGQLITDFRVLGPDDLRLIPPAPAKPFRFSQASTVFSRARQAGFNTAALGYYHPYGRVLNASLSYCWWEKTPWQANSMGGSFFEFLTNHTRSLFETDFRSPFGQALAVREHARITFESWKEARSLVVRPEFGFVFLHLPVPHIPHAYNPVTGSFDLRPSVAGYWNSLILLDRMLGDLRRAMERAGLWDETAVVMSSDHWYDSAHRLTGRGDHRVPFLIKMPRPQAALTYEAPFNTVLTHDLLMGILDGGIASGEVAARWLDLHRSIADTPYVFETLP